MSQNLAEAPMGTTAERAVVTGQAGAAPDKKEYPERVEEATIVVALRSGDAARAQELAEKYYGKAPNFRRRELLRRARELESHPGFGQAGVAHDGGHR